MRVEHIPLITNDNKEFLTKNSEPFEVRQNIDGYIPCYLCYNHSDYNVFDKNLEIIKNVNITFKDDVSFINPIIDVYLDYEDIGQTPFPNINQVNYVYFTVLGKTRYYFVVDIISVTNTIWTLLLKEDVLMTFKSNILACKGFISRNEFAYDNFLCDDKIIINEGVDIDYYEIPNTIFLDEISSRDVVFIVNGYKLSATEKPIN